MTQLVNLRNPFFGPNGALYLPRDNPHPLDSDWDIPSSAVVSDKGVEEHEELLALAPAAYAPGTKLIPGVDFDEDHPPLVPGTLIAQPGEGFIPERLPTPNVAPKAGEKPADVSSLAPSKDFSQAAKPGETKGAPVTKVDQTAKNDVKTVDNTK